MALGMAEQDRRTRQGDLYTIGDSLHNRGLLQRRDTINRKEPESLDSPLPVSIDGFVTKLLRSSTWCQKQVPEAAVADGVDDEKEYVYLMEGEEKKQQRVRVGRHVGDRLEILRGLKPGDKILAKNPD